MGLRLTSKSGGGGSEIFKRSRGGLLRLGGAEPEEIGLEGDGGGGARGG